MRFATLHHAPGTPSGRCSFEDAGSDRFVDLRAADPELPATSRAFSPTRRRTRPGPRGTRPRRPASKQFVTGEILCAAPQPRQSSLHRPQLPRPRPGNQGPIPGEPIVFSKFSTAVIGPGVPILLPRASQKVDYEAELVVVIGRRGKIISGGRRSRVYRRLHEGKRRLGPRLANGEAGKTMASGQDARHLRPDRPLPGDGRRSPRPPQPANPPAAQRPDDAGFDHERADFQPERS